MKAIPGQAAPAALTAREAEAVWRAAGGRDSGGKHFRLKSLPPPVLTNCLNKQMPTYSRTDLYLAGIENGKLSLSRSKSTFE